MINQARTELQGYSVLFLAGIGNESYDDATKDGGYTLNVWFLFDVSSTIHLTSHLMRDQSPKTTADGY